MASYNIQSLLWILVTCCLGILLLLYGTSEMTPFIQPQPVTQIPSTGLSRINYTKQPHPIERIFNLVLPRINLTEHLSQPVPQTITTELPRRANKTRQKVGYLVHSPFCKIRNQDPYDISIRSLLKKGTPPFECTKYKSFTYQEGNTIYINYTTVNLSNHSNTFRGCYVLPIYRPVNAKSNHNSASYLRKSGLFRNSYRVKHEYVAVKCLDSKGEVIHENMYSFIIKKDAVEQHCKERLKGRKQKSLDTFNVMIIGLDSVSRLNSMRYLKKTRSYLLNEMKAVEMMGYNKVGDNTFDNMVPLLTGKYPKELPWTTENKTVFDRFNFAWKNFSEHGYRTLFLEDLPHGAIFDYVKPGFHNNPTDYYNRHFQLIMTERDLWYGDKNCFVDRSQTDIVMNFTYRFMTTFKNDPYFGFVFITRLTHDILEQTAAADDIYYNYMKEIHKNDLLENTILIFMSDHGIRFGNIRSYFIGKMEERLPMFYVVLPEKFRSKYPRIEKNLNENSRKLTTPFDVHETLMDLLYLKRDDARHEKLQSNSRAYSLLREIPENRSCANANIDQHWCTCSQQQKISVNDRFVARGAHFLISRINLMLQNVRDLCMKLRVMGTVTAYKLVTGNENLYGPQSVLQINVRAAPGGAIFEATVVYDKVRERFTLGGDISRINTYGSEKRCSVEHRLEKLCYCRSNLS